MTTDFSDLNAQIECRARILTFLGGSLDYPLYWVWRDRLTCHRLSYSQCEQLSEWLKVQCRETYKATYGKTQNHPLPGQTVELT